MRVATNTDDRELTLEAMWHGYRASNFARQYRVEIDTGVVQALLNARYYESTRGQFISQDPSFLSIGDLNAVKQVTGQDQRAFLADPQLVNSYNYGRDNPITNKDPNGNASYIWDNGGGMTGIDTWNPNTYYESGDRALLRHNAGLVQAAGPVSGAALFIGNVKPGGNWDYKRGPRDYYFFNGQLIDKEAFGNVNYGYTGTGAGFGPDILKDAAGFVQVYKNTTYPSIRTNYDDPKDTANIQRGINAYRSTNPAVASRMSQAAYSAPLASGQTTSRILNSLYAALTQALSVIKNLQAKPTMIYANCVEVHDCGHLRSGSGSFQSLADR